MKTTISKETKTTPSVVFNHSNNTLTISGKSIPFEPELFWSLIINQIKNIKKLKIIEFNLEYINTNSIPFIIKLIKTSEFDIHWMCDESDIDLCELGEILKTLTKNNFIVFEFEN